MESKVVREDIHGEVTDFTKNVSGGAKMVKIGRFEIPAAASESPCAGRPVGGPLLGPVRSRVDLVLHPVARALDDHRVGVVL